MTNPIRVLLLLASLPAVGEAQLPAPGELQPAHLNGMPSVARVRDTIRGRDPLDTATRQIAAFHQLRRMLEEASGGRVYDNTLTPDETRLMLAYGTAKHELAAPIESSLSPRERSQWFARRSELETSNEFRDELLEALFAPQWVEWYRETTHTAGEPRARRSEGSMREGPVSEEARRRVGMLGLGSFFLSILLLLITLWRETRAFGVDPRNPERVRAGFRSYAVESATGTLTGVSEKKHVEKTATYDSDGKILTAGERTTAAKSCTLESIEERGGRHTLTDLPLYAPVEEGDAASLLWLSGPGRKTRYFLLVNHTQGSSVDLESVLGKKSMDPWLWPVLPLAWVGIGLAQFPPFHHSPKIMFVAVVCACLGFLVWRGHAARRRSEEFMAKWEKLWIDRMHERADRLFGRRLRESR